MLFRLIIFGIIFQFLISGVLAQGNRQIGYMPWHRLDTIKLNYLAIDKTNDSAKSCELHFLIKISGDAFTKQHSHLAKSFLNSCVKNYMFNDSWIDTTYSITPQIQFMQIKFDLAEMYARKLRKALYENGHATNKFVKTIQKALMTECKKEFGRLELETINGKNKEKLEEWKNYISTNLKILAEYESSERSTPTNGT
jgi:hypothetical protein